MKSSSRFKQQQRWLGDFGRFLNALPHWRSRVSRSSISKVFAESPRLRYATQADLRREGLISTQRASQPGWPFVFAVNRREMLTPWPWAGGPRKRPGA